MLPFYVPLTKWKGFGPFGIATPEKNLRALVSKITFFLTGLAARKLKLKIPKGTAEQVRQSVPLKNWIMAGIKTKPVIRPTIIARTRVQCFFHSVLDLCLILLEKGFFLL